MSDPFWCRRWGCERCVSVIFGLNLPEVQSEILGAVRRSKESRINGVWTVCTLLTEVREPYKGHDRVVGPGVLHESG